MQLSYAKLSFTFTDSDFGPAEFVRGDLPGRAVYGSVQVVHLRQGQAANDAHDRRQSHRKTLRARPPISLEPRDRRSSQGCCSIIL